MKLGHLELFVENPLASLPFYRDVLGFEVTTIQDNKFVWLKLGQQEILLRPGRPLFTPPTYNDARFGIVLYVDNLPGIVETLRQRGLTVECMLDEPDCYVFADKDGNWFQLVDPSEH